MIRFPTQWEDSYSVVKWVYDSAVHELPKLEKDPKIAVCGEGAGGLLAAAVCQMARDRYLLMAYFIIFLRG